MKQNTFHPLTASLISAVIYTLPSNISSDHMQTWIENPMTLRKALKETLDSDFIVMDPTDKVTGGKLQMRIIKIGDSTFHKQTAKFISAIIQNIPEIRNDKMELWINNMNTLHQELRKMFTSNFILIHPDDVKARKVINKF